MYHQYMHVQKIKFELGMSQVLDHFIPVLISKHKKSFVTAFVRNQCLLLRHGIFKSFLKPLSSKGEEPALFLIFFF